MASVTKAEAKALLIESLEDEMSELQDQEKDIKKNIEKVKSKIDLLRIRI
jgi:chaperonin cofactor prefoldin